MNNKSKWDSLTLKEKSEIMKMAISSGVMDLDNIKSSYNSFAEGGLMPDEPERKIIRVRDNDSPTKEGSEKVEKDIARRHMGLVREADRKGHPSDAYYIPYVQEIKIPGIGRTSVSILDSIAVNAKRAGIPMEDAYGLAAVETVLGAIPNTSINTDAYINGYIKRHGKSPTEEEINEYKRRIMNSSFARNYGGIYPQFLINNHEWSERGWEQSPKYKPLLENIQSPLEHGFTLYKMGLYNTGDANHTKKVQNRGRQIMSTPVFQEYMKNSKFHK